MKHLELRRPLVFFDLETTGLNIKYDRIVEISVLKLNPDGAEEFKKVLVNPGIPIPPEASAIHGISDADVAGKPAFRQYARSLCDFFSGCDLCGFSAKRFDLPLLEEEFRRAGVEFCRDGMAVIDIKIIYHRYEPRDLEAAYQRYCHKKLENNHSSEADVRATKEIFEGQLECYPDLPRDVDALHRLCCDPDEDKWVDRDGKLIRASGGIAINFGKEKGQLLQELAQHRPDYLEWVLRSRFSAEVKSIIQEHLDNL